ncbi:thioredoxin-like, partial [Halichoeres trimaculatus]|uniref:thioredoxin-like n=1 Tax=Halichoeres trimaculatus TaxID=147232 RepID=UPI003D9F0F95
TDVSRRLLTEPKKLQYLYETVDESEHHDPLLNLVLHLPWVEKGHFQEVLKEAGDKLLVVDFSASWCGPCRAIHPVYEEASKNPKYKNVIFAEVDVDEAGDVAQACDISCMPTFQFYRNGSKIDEFKGAGPDELIKKLDKYMT